MNCPACNRPLRVAEAFSSTKGDNGKKLVYSYRYLSCGEHAWQTAEQRAVQIKTMWLFCTLILVITIFGILLVSNISDGDWFKFPQQLIDKL